MILYKSQVENRSDLLTLLSEACELEHGLACSYLYSAFSLKNSLDEDLSTTELHKVKQWASQIFFIASQEMFHLAQVWNLLTSIGGTPYYFRPNFPQKSKYYPLGIPLKLEPFSLNALKRFILYEYPSNLSEKNYIKENFSGVSDSEFNFKTVGDLYEIIENGFKRLDEKELFIGNINNQIDTESIDFTNIVKVFDKASAIKAIEQITEQGEGTKIDREDCHFGMFLSIEKEYSSLLGENSRFKPARNIISNPIVFDRGDLGINVSGTILTNEYTQEVSNLFDGIYNLMLRLLQYAFSSSNIEKKNKLLFSSLSINLMVRVLKPLGEALTFLPFGKQNNGKKSGPSFSMVRHVFLPQEFEVALKVVLERLNNLIKKLNNLAIDPRAPDHLRAASQNLSSLNSMILMEKE